ncbi:MAG: hypothetical protein ACRYFV_20670 [Janthinobacterium lividum]
MAARFMSASTCTYSTVVLILTWSISLLQHRDIAVPARELGANRLAAEVLVDARFDAELLTYRREYLVGVLVGIAVEAG